MEEILKYDHLCVKSVEQHFPVVQKMDLIFESLVFTVLGNNPVSSLILVDVRQKMEQSLKRKKEKAENKSKKCKAARRQSENKQTEPDKSTSLSDSDKQMLERWEKMRKQTKPFIHPIRKYMKELHDLKEEVLCDDTTVGVATTQPLLPPLGSQIQQQFQFTQFVPQNQNGNATGLKAVKVPSQAVPIATQSVQGGCAIAQTGMSAD